MRRLLWLLLLVVPFARAQVVGPGFLDYVTSAPSGTCSQGQHMQQVLGSGDIYTCASGTWAKAGGSGGGTVTSVSFTGGLISVANPTTTPAFTVAGTSGGIPYFSGAATWASSGALTQHAIVLGGGAGATPTVVGSLGTSTTLLHGAAAGDPTFGAVNLASEVTGQLPIAAVGSAGLSGTSPMAIASTGAISITANGITASQLATQYAILRCYPGLGDGLNAISAGTYLQTNCYNNSGVTWTITRIGCFTDNSGTSTLNATNGAATALLTGAVTCTTAAGGAAGTQSATTTIANGDVIKFTFVADGTSKQTGWFVTLTQ